METAATRSVETLEEARIHIADLTAELACLEAERDCFRRMSEELLTKLKLANHRSFAPSSEASDDQLELFNEAEATANESVAEPKVETITYRRRKRIGKREADFSTLEHVRIDYELDKDKRICPACENPLHDMGSEVRRELTIIPARMYVTEHAAHKYACRVCDRKAYTTPIIKASAPIPLLPKSIASASLLAHIITNKYTLSLPLYRQEADFAAKGIDISRQNMANWVCATASALEPVYEHMKSDLLKSEVLHADETTMQVLREPDKKASAKSYMWLYRTGSDATHPLVIYEWQKSRGAPVPKEFLRAWSGYLHTDGYEAYHKLEHPTIVGCMAHVRRKFDEAYKIVPEEERLDSLAAVGLTFCNRLFALEKTWVDLDPGSRQELRLEKSKPLFDEFVAWAKSARALPKSAPGLAIHYLLSQEPYLRNFYLDGRLELSNNRAERSIKPFIIGRKNWLFANTVKGAQASALLYSLIETAKENNLKVFDYLCWLFEQLPNTAPERISDLCPHSGILPEELYVTKR